MASAAVHLPAGVWVLGFVSLLMDISSEMIHSLLPMFLVGTLGVSVLAVGIIEGIAESTALIAKVFSGALSDYLGRRKGLAVLGYAMGAFTKPLSRWPAASVPWSRRASSTASARASAARRATRCSPTSRRPRSAARRSGCASRWTRSGAFVGPLLAIALMLAVGRRLPRRVLGRGRARGAGGGCCWWSASASPRVPPPSRRGEPDPPRSPGAAGRRLLAGRRHRRDLHAGPLQRGLPGPARAAGRHRRGLGAAGDGRDEPRLRRQPPTPSASSRTR